MSLDVSNKLKEKARNIFHSVLESLDKVCFYFLPIFYYYRQLVFRKRILLLNLLRRQRIPFRNSINSMYAPITAHLLKLQMALLEAFTLMSIFQRITQVLRHTLATAGRLTRIENLLPALRGQWQCLYPSRISPSL